jgi:hypothetical protein
MRDRELLRVHAFTWSNGIARIRYDLPPMGTKEEADMSEYKNMNYNKSKSPRKQPQLTRYSCIKN